MYDLRNPSIIMCSSELESALDMKSLHVTEIRDLVLRQLDKIKQYVPPLAQLAQIAHHI